LSLYLYWRKGEGEASLTIADKFSILMTREEKNGLKKDEGS